MLGVRVNVTKFVEDFFPGIVECQVTDAHGHTWTFVEKAPVVSADFLDEDSVYPQPGVIPCRIEGHIRRPGGMELVRITAFPFRTVPEMDDDPQLDVLPEQIVEV